MEQKKRFSFLVILLFLFTSSCKVNNQKDDGLIGETTYFIGEGDLLINNTFYTLGKTDSIYSLLGLPLNIDSNGFDCGNYFEFTNGILSYDNFIFETNEQEYIVRKIMFNDNGITVNFNNIIFHHEYTRDSLILDFPNDNFSLDRDIEITTSPESDWYGFWRFHFDNEMLSFIEFVVLC